MQRGGANYHVCFLPVGVGDLKVAIVTKVPEKCSDMYIYIYSRNR
jgi:hypothetical protein